MAVERRLSFYSGQRVDIPHIRALESAVSHDFDMLLRGMFTGLNKPFLVRGFKIKIPNAAINASNLQIEVADSVLLHSSATESGTVLHVPAATADETLSPQNSKVIGAFQANAINYVALDYRRATDALTVDQTAGWSPSQQIEYQRAVPIGRMLNYRFIITTNGFSTNLPLYIVKTTSTGAVEYITKATTNFFRLGSGGANPDPSYSYGFGNYVNTQPGSNPRREWIGDTSGANQLTVEPGDSLLAFDYGDFAIKNLKEWMDAIMTRFKEITKSDYWYLDSNLPSGDQLNLADLQWDSIGSVITGTGELSYNLVLESTLPSLGAYQSSFTDNSVLPGDVYVEGKDSFTKATLTSFSNGRLIINSLTSAAFIYSEALWMRRLFRPLASIWELGDYVAGDSRFGDFRRVSYTSGVLTNNISAWSYQNMPATNSLTADFALSEITVITVGPHGLQVGDFARIEGLSSPIVAAPNGVHRVNSITSPTQFTFLVNARQDGITSVLGTNGVLLDSGERHPYTPSFEIEDFQPYGLTEGELTLTNHNLSAPQLTLGDYTLGSNIITNITNISGLKVGQVVLSSQLTGGEGYIVRIDTSLNLIEVSSDAIANAVADSTTVKDRIFVEGLSATGQTYDDMNGMFDVESIGLSNEVRIDFGFAITGTAVVTGSRADVMLHKFTLKISDASPEQYNVIDVPALAIAGDKIQFKVGSDLLPTLNIAGGAYELDGVIAESTVVDPVRVSTITNDGLGTLTVTTYSPHNQITGGPQDFTIYGDSDLSDYIRSYTNINLVYVSPTQFQITGTGILSLASYTNSGTDKTFIAYADNPYAGPIQWSSDIVVKGIIGDLSITIPQTAVVDMSDSDVSPTANQFNVNGITGTAYLQDGEVLFIKLERNKIVSNNTVFSTLGGNSTIVTAGIMTDESSNPLVPGDFIKFADESEQRWLKIKTITPTAVVLETDRGQEPDLTQRPAKTGKMVYTKGSYDKVYVKKHHLVDASASTYWLGVRRDNDGSTGKVYFRNLEVEAGEVRQINDNQISNLLKYVGAASEASVNPNYSLSSSELQTNYTASLTIEAIDNLTQMITFEDAPVSGFHAGDRLMFDDGSQYNYFTVKTPISSRTVIVQQDTSILSALDNVTMYRENRFISDQDNLTIAHRKQDRQAGYVDTALNRPVYDESIYIQRINLSGAGTVKSGSYVYKGTSQNPTALAWVVHGNASATETIESALITMPGGHSSIGANAILVHVVAGSFLDGDGLYQNGVLTGRTVNNPGNPPFTAPALYGDDFAGGVELVLPPNKRTQVSSPSGIVTYGTHSFYKQSLESALTGEDLLVIVNDGIRTAAVDYEETFGGPKAKIRLKRSTPPNTRMRFRVLSAYGSALAAKSADVSLQTAYNVGSTIQTTFNRPVEITSDDVVNGSAGLINRGSIKINGGTNQLGGIFNETGDKGFVIGKEADKPKETWTALEALKSHTSHLGSANYRKTAAQVVTGATGTIITDSAITLDDNYAYRVKVNATGRRSDGTFGVASFTLEGTFYRSGGLAQAAGSPVSNINGSDGDGVSYAVVFGLSGNDVVAVVYGTAGSTIQWAVTVEWQAVGVA